MSIQLTKPFSASLAAADRSLVGMWACTGSTIVTEICAGSGLDWILIDMEHAPNTLESVLVQLQTVAAYPIVPVVRVPANDPVIIKRVLDIGAQNILVPMVSDAEEARAAVRAVHYPPRGIRGVGSALARSGRWSRVEGYMQNASDAVTLIVQIESAEAAANAEEIMAVEGIDAVYVGPADLGATMGLIGQTKHPDVAAAVSRVIAAAKSAGLPVGINAFDRDVANAYIAEGVDFITVAADVTLLARSSEELTAHFLGTSSDKHDNY
jgi:4-hydroxy-2-oxoheptanedioate aldolase